MDTASSVVESGVVLPAYEFITGQLLRQFEHASSVASTSSDDEGELFALFASMSPAESVPDGSIMIIPLTLAEEEEALDFTFLARGKSLLVKIQEVPRGRNTYGRVVSYSAGTVDKPYPIRFATTTNFVIAKPRLVDIVTAISRTSRAEVDITTEWSTLSGKRPRQLEGGRRVGGGHWR